MNKLSRRRLLALGLVAGGIGVGGAAWALGRDPHESAGRTLTSALPPPQRFRAPLPIPPVARPTHGDHYDITQRPSKVEIVPGTTTTVWGFDGHFPGPTLRVRRGREVTVKIHNRLPVPTTTHLHGGVTPASSDGFPTDLVVPKGYRWRPASHHKDVWTRHDQARTYEYPIDQPAATLWYHDHRMDFTAPQVWRGLAGFFIVDDDVADALPLPRGDRDVPLFICDRAFAADGEFLYPSVDGTLAKPGVTGDFHQGVQGDVILVNGAPWPVMDVDRARYRFRVLNGSNARRYRLALGTAPTEAAFTQIASDVGLLGAPVPLDACDLAPAERRELVIDFAHFPAGSEVTLLNTLDDGPTGAIMRFRVGASTRDDSEVPETLAPYEKLDPADVAADRFFRFQVEGDKWTINDQTYDPAGTIARATLDTIERWTFTSDFHHPIHVHLGHFQVASRDGKPPRPQDAGWKDTVDLRPFEVVEVLVRFAKHKGRYMIHCHNLEHEDMAMMANFDVV
ncbi:MAG TPA: multicopper oxidase family protein [Stackebrandtia sp.]|jgi:FtsP/CotA-like multicopper oxidase with cupredoxin domain|uniref:multicopper oxidase family protein n=1 Tax=Stackebrandtia sp. TaxID=2023065 RepID=UPI002D293A84|nr:multicopper oxidase family protein [Stackebrandtia sp.]HZE37577.1 multicopper oxidase family protein [Stackebrandtia sp.]